MTSLEASCRALAYYCAVAAAVGSSLIIGPPSANAAPMEYILKRGVFEVCASPDAMPFSQMRPSGGGIGLHIDLGEALARELGVGAKFSFVNFQYEAKHTSCDAFMSVGVLDGEQEKGPVKRTVPIIQYDTLMITKPERTITKIEDLDGLKIATQSGSLAHVTLLKRPVDVRVSLLHEDDLLNALDRGDIDVGIVTNIGYYWFLKNNPSKAFRAQPASIVQTPTAYPIAIGLRKPDDKTLALTNAAIARLQASGEMLTIFTKYGIEAAYFKPAK